MQIPDFWKVAHIMFYDNPCKSVFSVSPWFGKNFNGSERRAQGNKRKGERENGRRRDSETL